MTSGLSHIREDNTGKKPETVLDIIDDCESLNRFNLFLNVVMAESFIQNFLFPVDKQKVLHLSDPLINVIGTWGVWQISSFLYLSLMVAWDASHMFNMKFTTYTVDYWCEKPIQYRHLSNEVWLNISSPLNTDSTTAVSSQNLPKKTLLPNVGNFPQSGDIWWWHGDRIFQVGIWHYKGKIHGESFSNPRQIWLHSFEQFEFYFFKSIF